MFNATHVPDIQGRAEDHLKDLSRHFSVLELRKTAQKDITGRKFPSKLCSLYLDALQHALARNDKEQMEEVVSIITSVIHGLLPLGQSIGLAQRDLLPILHMLANRFSALCFDETAIRRIAGCTGLKILSAMPGIGVEWTKERDVDLVRTLLHVLKDSPHDPPQNMTDVVEILNHVLQISCRTKYAVNANALPQDSIPFLTGIFFADLASPHPVV